MKVRFEVGSAVALGVAIPVLETVRRGFDFSDVTTLAEDYLVGFVLLGAAWSALSQWRSSPVLLVIAWAMLSGGLFPSFFGHLESLLRGHVSGSREATIVGVKAVLYAISMISLVLSARGLSRSVRAA